LLPSASGQACFRMAFPPFLTKQLYRCKYNTSFRQNTGLQEKLDTACKLNVT
jgi:hypothetical protein